MIVGVGRILEFFKQKSAHKKTKYIKFYRLLLKLAKIYKKTLKNIKSS
ncbi:hypothetical protein [Campylobacter pinnipediorum]|nr:hypothetical protein [Campylobacter pinnipediorum]